MTEAALGSPRYGLNRVVYDLARRPDARAVITDKAGFLGSYSLKEAERAALLGPDFKSLLALGLLPNLAYRYYILHGMPPESFPQALAGST